MALMINSFLISILSMFDLRHSRDGANFNIFILSLSFFIICSPCSYVLIYNSRYHKTIQMPISKASATRGRNFETFFWKYNQRLLYTMFVQQFLKYTINLSNARQTGTQHRIVSMKDCEQNIDSKLFAIESRANIDRSNFSCYIYRSTTLRIRA